MPQPYQRRPERYSVPDAEGPRVLPTVSASPVDPVVEVRRVSPEVEGLLRGLSSLNSSLAQREAQDEREGEKRKADGRSFAAAGGSRADAEARGDKSFLEGFFEGEGAASAIKDAQEAEAAAQEELNRNGGDIHSYIGQFYQKKMAGQDNEAFRRGYDRVFGQEAMKIRAAFAERTAREVLDRNSQNAMMLIDRAVAMRYQKGQPLPPEILADVNRIAKDQGISNAAKDEMLFLTLKRYSEAGDADVWGVARVPRVDSKTGQPLPSMYSNPKWKERIDVEERQAKSIALAQANADRAALKEERVSRQQEAIGSLIQLGLDGKVDEATALKNRLLKDRTLFSRADEIESAMRLFDSSIKSVEKPGEKLAENRYLIEIYAGKLGPMEILQKTDIGVDTQRSLIREWRSHQSMLKAEQSQAASAAAAARSASAAERTAYLAAFSDPIFRSSTDNIERQLAPVRNRMMPNFGPVDSAHERQQTLAVQEFTAWRASNPNASRSELMAKEQEIVSRFLTSRKGDPSGVELLRLQGIPYRNHGQLLAAFERGEITPDVFTKYNAILKDARQGQNQ